jgi:hypothetical protein
MFGRHYHQRDIAVAASSSHSHAYACALLAELLDRARLLEGVRRTPGRRDRGEPLAVAVDLFLLDVAEARARGLRARLFCRTPDGHLDPWSVDPGDDLHDLGGELVAVTVTPQAESRAGATPPTDTP